MHFKEDIISVLRNCKQIPDATVHDYVKMITANIKLSKEHEERKELVGMLSQCSYQRFGETKVAYKTIYECRTC